MDSNGSNTVVAWTSLTASNTLNVYARVLNSDGTPHTETITVQTDLPYSSTAPVTVDVGIDSTGRFAVVFDRLPNASAGQSDVGLQRYAADGTAFGGVVFVGNTNRVEVNPSVDLSSTGRIVVGYDQLATATNSHRAISVLYAAFDNVASSATTSLSTTSGIVTLTTDVAFNAAGQYLFLYSALRASDAIHTMRVFQTNGTVTSSQSITTSAIGQGAIENIPGSDNWLFVCATEDSGQNQLGMFSITPNGISAPSISDKTVLAVDILFGEKQGLTVDSDGNMGIMYRTVNADSQPELRVNTYSSAGSMLSSKVILTGDGVSASYALARGVNAFDSMAAYAEQTEFGETDGSLVDFEIRGATFGAPTNVLPSTGTVRRNGILSFTNGNRLQVNDVPAGNSIRVELQVLIGTLTVTGLAGVTVAGNGTGIMVLTGDITKVNLVLGSLRYITKPGWIGNASLRMKSKDLSYGASAPEAEDTMTIAVVNTPATAPFSGLAYQAVAGRPLAVSAANGLLRGARDADGDRLTVRIWTRPRVGRLVLRADGSFVYVPPARFSGRVTFTVVYSDGLSTSRPVTVTIDVKRPVTPAARVKPVARIKPVVHAIPFPVRRRWR